MGPRLSLGLLAAGGLLVLLGVGCFTSGVVGYNAWALASQRQTISEHLAAWGRAYPVLPAFLAMVWFGGLCGGLFGLGCLMVGHWWWR